MSVHMFTQFRMMMWLFGILFAEIVTCKESVILNSNEEILVAFSNRPPFVYKDENGALKGLDILIIENFARKFDRRIKYEEMNKSLNEMFNQEENIEKKLDGIEVKTRKISISKMINCLF